jgi:lysophospholipase L1-like esterase
LPRFALPDRRVLAALAGALALQACSGSNTQPSPPPPPIPDPPKLTCPAPVSVLSPLATPISVVFGTPTVVAGAPPVTTACTPDSGTTFSVGPTIVSCTATDSRQRTDTCTFTVTVTVPPKIGATKYVAFGDSMTAGEIVSEGSGGFRTLRVDPARAYPADLQRELAGTYTTQASSISVDNQGLSGEPAVSGVSRLPSVLARNNYDVLTLMEGANDIADRDSKTAQLGLDALRSMVRTAKGRGLRVVIATLPPQNPAGFRGLSAGMVEPFNDGVRGIASDEGIALADVYAAFNGDLSLIDTDGLHPTADGYQKIADTFFKIIKQDLEQAAGASLNGPLTGPFRRMPMIVRPGRR